MLKRRVYRILLGTLGVAFLLFGLMLVASFFAYQQPGSTPAVPTGPVGHYFIAFTGCALVGWAGGLIAATRHSALSGPIGTWTAVALVLMSVVRILAWVTGDYYTWLGELPRIEAAFFLAVALAIVWLKPSVTKAMATPAAPVEASAD